jgi:hypothetical protein
LLVALAVATVTSTVPDPEGASHEMDFELFTTTLVAATPPK